MIYQNYTPQTRLSTGPNEFSLEPRPVQQSPAHHRIEPSRIVRGDPVEVSRRVLGMGTPVSSYTVVDDSGSKLFAANPVNLMTTDELLRDGYSPIAEIMASPLTSKYHHGL